MRKPLTLFLLLLACYGYANMASPYTDGTLASSAFSSRDIDILKERLLITIASDFRTASYVVEYFIKADSGGRQIPLLFHADNYKGDFRVWVDGREVKLQDIPHDYKSTLNTPFEKFSQIFRAPSRPGEYETVEISWWKDVSYGYTINDLKYFEADLTKGLHRIRVEYTGNARINHSGWVKEYSLHYSLSPARFWRSFDSLQIIIRSADFSSDFTTYIGEAAYAKVGNVAEWSFREIPADFLKIMYKPEISLFAKTMIAFSPEGLTILFGLLLALFHFSFVKEFRKRYPQAKHSVVVIAGSIIVPFVILIGYPVSYGIIDSTIGEHAGSSHGYAFMVVILYPLFFLIYWAIMAAIDKMIKQNLQKKNTLNQIKTNEK
jgi:hypothetical protein